MGGDLGGEEFWAERRRDARLLDESQTPLLLLAVVALAVRLAIIFSVVGVLSESDEQRCSCGGGGVQN